MDPLRFDGEAFVVTGAGRGIGRAYARLLASRGAKILVNDFGGPADGTSKTGDESVSEQVAAEIRAAGGVAFPNGDSVATPEGAAAIVDTAHQHFGRIDGVICNAGIVRLGKLLDSDSDSLHQMLSVHVHGQVNVCRALWPHFLQHGYGRVVLTGSTGMFGAANIFDYTIAKAAIVGLLKTLAVTDPDAGIRVNAIAPQAATRMGAPSGPGEVQWIKEQAEARGEPAHVAPLGALLLHRDCPITGKMFTAGGGGVAVIEFMETRGISVPGLKPEDILARIDEVLDPTDAWTPTTMNNHLQPFRELHPLVPPAAV